MTLRKTTVDNSVRYVNKNDHSHSDQTPPFSKKRKKGVSKGKPSQNHEKKFRKSISRRFKNY